MAFSALMGARVKRKEDPRLITGSAQYTGDLTLPGMKFVAFVRSPYAHALIRNIDSSAARGLPGVVAVLTGADLRAAYNPMPMEDAGKDDTHTHYPLSVERVRYAGEPVACVVADSAQAAADAALAVSVEWEPLPVAGDLPSAVAANAPKLFADLSDNVGHVWARKRGEPEKAFTEAHHVVKLNMINQRLAGVPMEPRATLAAPDPFTGGLALWTSTQSAHGVRTELAKILKLPENTVRVVAPEVGGGFGLKIGLFAEDAVLAALALRLKCPVRWTETRSEHMLATTHGRAQSAEVEAAVQADGAVTALRVRVLQDLGAYPRVTTIGELTGKMAVGVYHIRNVDLEIKCVFTNTTPVAAYRGAGRPEAAYYIERLMDAVAAELNLDPTEVRRKNFIPPDVFPHRTAAGFTYDSGDYDKALSRALQISNYPLLREEQRRRLVETRGGASLLGIGIAT
ncbi:MAG: xanthine dehydrogenase family protein molybdopterin-binding subunit, partial [Anaerolineales bacterium]